MDTSMTVGWLFDWVSRIFGVLFLLCVIYVMIFPSWNPELEAGEKQADQEELRQDGPRRLHVVPGERRQVHREHGTVVLLSSHRRGEP
jgi:hypothetical protein